VLVDVIEELPMAIPLERSKVSVLVVIMKSIECAKHRDFESNEKCDTYSKPLIGFVGSGAISPTLEFRDIITLEPRLISVDQRPGTRRWYSST
jgi:hypothetical protein